MPKPEPDKNRLEVVRQDMDAVIAPVLALTGKGRKRAAIVHNAASQCVELLFSPQVRQDQKALAYHLDPMIFRRLAKGGQEQGHSARYHG